MPVITVRSADDLRLEPFRSLTDAALRRASDALHGTYIAESFPVIERALAAGHDLHAALIAPRFVDRAEAVFGRASTVYTAEADIVERITGYDVHRGALAVMRRPAPRALSEVLGHGDVVVIDGVTDATNVGAVFRNAAALGASAVILTPATGDPLYRRSVRVSMGTVFQVAWARTSGWTELRAELRAHGYRVAAMALTPDATAIEDYAPADAVALVLGAEGPGLGADALAAADDVVMIPMGAGVDSLNVAAASAVALYALRARG